MGGESSDEEGRRWSTPSLRVVRRSVSWCDVAGRGELEAVLSIERRPKRPSFFSQSLSIIKVRHNGRSCNFAARAPVGASSAVPAPRQRAPHTARRGAPARGAPPGLPSACISRYSRALTCRNASQDEFLFSFRGAMSRDGAMLEAVPPDAATACADSEAERALFEARANTVLNVERVRAMAESLP